MIEALQVAAVPAMQIPQVGIGLVDQFQTRNNFYGGQIGFDTELHSGPWSLQLLTKLALGSVNQTVNINGGTVFATSAGATPIQPGGLLALPSNIGQYKRDRFAILPEFGIKGGYDVTDWCRLTVGYNILGLSNVTRPEEQIDPRVNRSQQPVALLQGNSVTAMPGTVTGPLFPQFTGRDGAFWMQGLTLGLEFRW